MNRGPLVNLMNFNDVLSTFLSFEYGSSVAEYWVRKRSDVIQNILMCVPKMNEGLTGLEQHEGE